MDNNKKTILLVDDDYDYLLQQKSLLELEGYNVITSEGHKKAKETLKSASFDLAIVDLMMEDMDSGFILSYEIKKMYPSTPVIMVTAVTNKTGMEFDTITNSEKKWIKADKIFTKPVRIEQLVKEINRLLHHEVQAGNM